MQSRIPPYLVNDDCSYEDPGNISHLYNLSDNFREKPLEEFK